MIVESCQILATGFSLNRLASNDCPRTQKGTPRKHFNPKHPSCLWARESTGNFDWLIMHTLGLLDEKKYRYPNGSRHFCHDFVDWVINNIDDAEIPKQDQTEFSIAISEDSKCRQHPLFNNGSVIDKYRLYYTHDKPFANWSKREAPDWFFDKKYQPQ
jgi:hypothetical protein